jgi:type I restriction enzyme S subunit
MVEGFKNTEVGTIPIDWKVKNIVENSTMKARIGWQGLTVSEYLDKGDYFLITGTDFVEGKIKWDTCHFVDKSRYDQDKNIQIKEGDILITKDGTIGKIAFVDDLTLPATLNSGIFVIRPKKNDNYLPKFLFYIFNSFYFNDFLNRLTAGSTIVHLYQKDFTSFNFPLPPTKTEQTAIATALKDADALIQKLEQLIAKKRNIKTGAIQELLKRKEGWEVKKLGEVTDIIRGGSPRPIEAYLTKDVNGINWIKIGDVDKSAKYIFSTEERIIPKGAVYSRTVKEGDFLLSNSMSFGRPYILKISGCVHDGWLVIQNYHDTFETNFLYYLLGSETTLKQYRNLAAGSTVLNLNKEIVTKVSVSYPNLEEQTRIAQILSDMDNEIQELEKQLEKYQMMKQGMMQSLLTGKIRLV